MGRTLKVVAAVAGMLCTIAATVAVGCGLAYLVVDAYASHYTTAPLYVALVLLGALFIFYWALCFAGAVALEVAEFVCGVKLLD